MKAFWLTLALAAFHGGLAAQDVAARLDGRVSMDVARAVQAIAHDAAARGLPVEPLIQKAIEGGAKRVPGDRVIAAVRMLAVRLDEARGALHAGGIPRPSPEAVESGADALNAGLTTGQVREIASVSRPPYDPALTLRAAATLTALGVPAEQGLRLMARAIKTGRQPSDLLDLPNQVQIGMARGATAGEAAGELDAAQGPEHGQEHNGQQSQQTPQDQQSPGALQNPQNPQDQQGQGGNPRKP